MCFILTQKDYYLEGINMLLKHDETLENYKQILSEYQEIFRNTTNFIKGIVNYYFEQCFQYLWVNLSALGMTSKHI